MNLWRNFTNVIVSKTLRMGRGAVIKVVNSDNTESEVSLTELAALDGIAASDLAKIDGITDGTGAASKALVLDSSGNVAMPDNGSLALSRAAVAAAGTTAADATVLADQVNAVTGADGTTGVALPAAATTTGPIYVINTVLTSGADLKVYPVNGGNDNINGLAEDAAFTMGPGKAAWFIPTSATQWYVEDAAGVLTTTTEANILDGATVTAAELNRTCDISARVVTTTATALSLTVTEHADRVVLVNTNSTVANTFTLPAATGSGAKFTIINNIQQTQGTIVVAANGTDVMTGVAIIGDTTAETAGAFLTTATSDKLSMDLTTTGGQGGDQVELLDGAANTWTVRATLSGSGTLATPFSET